MTTFFDNFERGNDGDPVGGGWIIQNTTAEISTDYAYSGTRSLHLIYNGFSEIRAIYPVSAVGAQSIEVMLYKPSNGGMNIELGNGVKWIWFHFQPGGACYYYSSGWHSIGYTWPNGGWSKLGITNIDFSSGTYDIYRNLTPIMLSVPMQPGSGWTNQICLKATNDSGSNIYYDDITYIFEEEDTGFRYWVKGISSNWDNTNNWSLSSGGISGASIPDSSKIAVFNNGGNGDCFIDATVSVNGFRIDSDYTSVISQNGYPIFIGTQGASFLDGTFDGTNANIYIDGSFSLSGSEFYSTPESLTVYGDFIYDGTGSFYHRNGKVIKKATDTVFQADNAHFYDLRIEMNGDYTGYTLIKNEFFVDNALDLLSGYFKGDGTAHVWGDATCTSFFGIAGSDNTALVLMDGSGYQNVHNYVGAVWPSFAVDKTTLGEVILSEESPMFLNGSLSIIDGTLNTNGIDLYVGPGSGLRFQRTDSTIVPVIVDQPDSQEVYEGDSVTFSVESLE